MTKNPYSDKPKALGGLTPAEFEHYQNLKPDQRRNYLGRINKLYILDGTKAKKKW